MEFVSCRKGVFMKVKALLKAAVLGCVLACGSVAITGFGGSTVAASSYGSEYILLTGYGNTSYYLKKDTLSIDYYNPPYYRLSAKVLTHYKDGGWEDGLGDITFDYNYDRQTVTFKGQTIRKGQHFDRPFEADAAFRLMFKLAYGIDFYH